MPIERKDLPYVSCSVIHSITSQDSAFSKKVAPSTYRTCEPGNAKSHVSHLYSGLAQSKSVDAKPNPDGNGVVLVTIDNSKCTPKTAVDEETVEVTSMKEYHSAVESACKKADREDLIRVVFSKVVKIVEAEEEDE